MLPLLPEAFITLFGAEAAGIANPVNPLLEPHQIAEILEAARTSVLVALGPMPGTDIWQKVEQVRGSLKHLKAIVQVHGPGDPANKVYSFGDLSTRSHPTNLSAAGEFPADQIAAYFHTGGTTGTPKLVRHTHANQVYQAWAMNLLLKTKPGANLLFGMPLYHVGGSLTQALTTLSGGDCLVVLSAAGWRNPASIKNIWGLVERFKPETLSSVPTVLAGGICHPARQCRHIEPTICRWRRIGDSRGGWQSDPGQVWAQGPRGLRHDRDFERTHDGLSRSSDPPWLCRSPCALCPRSRRQARRRRPVRARLRGRRDRRRDHGGPGCLSGYLNEVHNKGAFVDGNWVNSGDLGRLDKDGFLWITGRAKDLVIRGGHNIDPAPVEEILFQHPAVGLAAVVGQPDAYAGELPVGYVQLKPGATVAAGELEAWVRERTPERAAVPVQIFQIDPMPLTGVGKVFKPQLRWDAAKRALTKILARSRKKESPAAFTSAPTAATAA